MGSSFLGLTYNRPSFSALFLQTPMNLRKQIREIVENLDNRDLSAAIRQLNRLSGGEDASGVSPYLEHVSTALEAESHALREQFRTSPNKGAGFEAIVRGLLARFSPRTVFATHGEIIDSHGNESGQIDAAIVSEIHPRGHTDGRPNVLLYDGVLAVAEAKMSLDTQELGKAIDGAAKVDAMRIHGENNNRTEDADAEWYDNADDIALPFFLVGLDCCVGLQTLVAEIQASAITAAVVFSHNTARTGIAVLNESRFPSSRTVEFLDTVGVRHESGAWETINPIGVIAWLAAHYRVPHLSLTDILPMYLLLEGDQADSGA